MPDTVAVQSRFQQVISRFLIVGFVALVGVVASAGILMAMSQRQTAWVSHTYQVERQIYAMRHAVAEIEALTWRTAAAQTPTRLADSLSAQGALDLSIEKLATLTADNPRQQARIPLLREAARQIDMVAETQMNLGAAHHSPQGDAVAGRMAETLTRLGAAMMGDEEHLMTLRIADQHETQRNFFVILGMGGVLLLIVGVLTFTNLRGYTRALNASREELRQMNLGLESAVQERTGELKRANEELQRFAYIVSHDLRSPLVNVMGFTAELEASTRTLGELVDQAEAENPALVSEAARYVVREDLPEAIHFIRSSTQKMDRLINAILRLSREGRRTLNPETIDLGQLSQQIVDSMRIRIDEAGAEVRISAGMPPVVCDRLALEQMLSNLIENAVKYRAAERPVTITVSARPVGPRIAIDVTDNGRGISPHDHERVFDLFRRSGQQDQPGEGIGLAHVRALSYRLGGSITLRSQPGVGSTFTINLPTHFIGE